MTRIALLAFAGALLFGTSTASAQFEATNLNCNTNSTFGDPDATPNGHISWPADNPVWEFDFSRPANSITESGTGLEIRDVYYDGRLVMRRGNAPVLNVEYDPGVSCNCYRDWQDSEVRFQADGVDPQFGCFARSMPGVVQTTCEKNQSESCTNGGNCGGDLGNFNGVTVEDYGSELVLTMHTSAGWYRYRMKWHFYLDGRIWPEYSFAAASAVCTNAGHRHHAYWRFDFDLEGTPNNDIVRERDDSGVVEIFENEADRTWGTSPRSDVYWTVEDGVTQRGYEIRPSDEDKMLPIDPFSKTDALVLKYNPLEMDDGNSFGSGSCAIDYSQMQNGESVVDEDIVFWYRSSAFHDAGNPWECDIVGPTLRPINFATSGEANAPEDGFRLDTAGPNPFTPFTTVRFRIPEAGFVSLELYDALGRRVRSLFDGDIAANRDETVRVDGSDLPAGTYTVRLASETRQATTRIVLVR